ncbi:MAG: hypothetical protein EP326_08405 [Deltaproteobacteria bacterium]|nr:MAG: hypothetical protein EP326_08405 [Deltaproteobacteria bacterium]
MKAKRLEARTIPLEMLSEKQINEMFNVYHKYYASVTKEVFVSDLSNKNHVIVLTDKIDGEIKGFSTILDYHFLLGGKKVKGVFSGDTIIEKEYWGGSALQMAFIMYMFKEKLKRPFSPLYWFLISKGYKTYLLMANNFVEHYPRFEEQTPTEKKSIMDKFATELYPQNYDPTSGLIKFEGIHDHLKGDVAPITDDMKIKNERIKFFSETNNSWEVGTELVCLARFDLGLPFRYPMKTVKKVVNRQLKGLSNAFESFLAIFGVRRA